MSKELFKWVLFILGILFFTGAACPSNDTTASNKIAQSEIYQSYSIKQNGQSYDITAYFRIGGKTGTTLALSSPSRVTFNGQPMQEHLNTSSGTYYNAQVPNNTPDAAFVFTDRNNRVYTNKTELSKTELAVNTLSINGGAPVALPLLRPAAETANLNLQMNDRTVFVGSTQSELNEAYYDKAKNSIIVLPSAWKKIPKGNVMMNLEVRNAIPTAQGTALGGEIVFTYNTVPLNAAFIKSKFRRNIDLANIKNIRTNRLATSNLTVKKSGSAHASVSANKEQSNKLPEK